MPTPSDFQGYEKALPGAADRILKLAEREQELRISNDQSEARRSLIGIVLGFLLSGTSVGGGVWAMYLDRDVSLGIGLNGLGALGAYPRHDSQMA
ncbi:MAG: DUF2335 domain-containing protein [bacterium]|nr:DUF2335 domain-containing protein [bacterium]MDE0644056.1 DUF2335 domain-containing protein [bacterium]